MNTRQKLTLGIAAIFMVTLTIVGVTYAYFFTRVEGTQNTNITANTATISSIVYVPENDTPVSLLNVLPGSDVTKNFGAKNPNEIAGTYEIFLTSAVPEAEGEEDYPEFLHPAVANDANCYAANVDTAGGDTTACYTGDYYDNIVYTLYEEDGKTLAEDVDGNTYENVPVKHDADLTQNAEQSIGTFRVEAATDATTPTTRNFVLKVSYLNKTTDTANNQNLEFNAALDIKVSIR